MCNVNISIGEDNMASWTEFRSVAPELAGLAEDRFAATDLVLLGTLRGDGWPRISPIEYSFFDGDFLMGSMWQAKKALDLLRDPRCVIHSATADKSGQQGDVKLYGRAHPIEPEREEAYWQHIFAKLNWRPEGPSHAFVFEVESGSFVRFTGDGTMHWLTWPGGDWRTRRSS
jgi:Pyridoxamine 5'-phosphate oxidase